MPTPGAPCFSMFPYEPKHGPSLSPLSLLSSHELTSGHQVPCDRGPFSPLPLYLIQTPSRFHSSFSILLLRPIYSPILHSITWNLSNSLSIFSPCGIQLNFFFSRVHATLQTSLPIHTSAHLLILPFVHRQTVLFQFFRGGFAILPLPKRIVSLFYH